MIKGSLNTEQRILYNMIKDIIDEDVLVEPMLGDCLKLSGSVITSTSIKGMFDRGLYVYYISVGKLGVYRNKWSEEWERYEE